MVDNILGFDEHVIEAEEDIVIDAQFLIQDLLVKHNMTRTELARKAGISKARLSQLMKPNANPTLRTLARIFYALGEKGTVKCSSHRPETEFAAETNCGSWAEVQQTAEVTSEHRSGRDRHTFFQAARLRVSHRFEWPANDDQNSYDEFARAA
ncbi:helix-turn-helix domain-containing protein [Methylobacterium indicum]|uniref:helix-turn-helix domain-containing protein n=1 Tax=Methylobacterium indicum TaxID=1775910 RepID=UPI0009E50FBF|nr:helix-turn-helix transcriptional regulator [Methylobacterium indicum]